MPGPRQHAGRAQYGQRDRRGGIAEGGGRDVNELVLADAIVDDGQVPRRYEATGRGGGQAELLRTALGREPPLDHGERAFGL